jgi:hypothetical protein
MGCTGSSFPEDEDSFLVKHGQFVKEANYLVPDLLNDTSLQRFNLQKGLMNARNSCYTMKLSDGKDILTIKGEAGQKHLMDMKENMVAVLIHGTRFSEVNGADATFNLPHMYVYTLKAYREGQPPCEFSVDDKQLYLFARLHKQGPASFEVCFPELMGNGQANVELFSTVAYVANVFKDGGIAIKKHGFGAVRCKPDPDNAEDYKVGVSPMVDPALAAVMVMIIEALKDR